MPWQDGASAGMPNFDREMQTGTPEMKKGREIETTATVSWIKVDSSYHFADTRQTCPLIGRLCNHRAVLMGFRETPEHDGAKCS